MLATIGEIDYFDQARIGDLGDPLSVYIGLISTYTELISSYGWHIHQLANTIVEYANYRKIKTGAYDTNISKELGSTGQTADILIIDLQNEHSFTRGQPIVLRNPDTYGVEFQGYIDSVSLRYEGKSSFHSISAIGFSYLTDKRLIKAGFENTTIDNIVARLFETYLVPEGIKLGRVARTDAPIKGIYFDLITLTEAFQKLADLAGFVWRIDNNRHFYFEPFQDNPSPWVIDETRLTRLDGYGVHYAGLEVCRGSTAYKNCLYLRGGQATTEELEESMRGDGSRTSFDLKYPVQSVTSILINGIVQTVGVSDEARDEDYIYFTGGSMEFTAGQLLTGQTSGANGIIALCVLESGAWDDDDAVGYLALVDRNGKKFTNEPISDVCAGMAQAIPEANFKYDFYYQVGSSTITQDSGETKLTNSDTLEVIYHGLYDLLAVVTARDAITAMAEIEQGTGRVDAVIDAPEYTDADELVAYGRSLLTKYAKDITELSFKTLSPGFEPGQSLPAVIPHLKIDDEFLITSVEISSSDAVIEYNIKATTGAPDATWLEVFGRRPIAKSTLDAAVIVLEDIAKDWYENELYNPFSDDPYRIYQYVEINAPWGGYRAAVTDIEISSDAVVVSAIIPVGEGIGKITHISLWGGHGVNAVGGSGLEYFSKPVLIEKSRSEILQIMFSFGKAGVWTTAEVALEGWNIPSMAGWMRYNNRSEGWI
jgi:hypothetical protein